MLKRILAILLAVSMMLCIVACGKEKDNGDKDKDSGNATTDQDLAAYIATYHPEETAESYVDDSVLQNDYDGYEFTFLNSSAVYYMYIYLDPDMTGDVLDDACYERNFLAEQYFNITINEETQAYGDLASYAKTLILSGEDVYDAMYIPAKELTPLISENLFVDLLQMKELNIDKIWWDQPLITRNIIDGRLFYATSDLSLMAFEGVWCLYFNEDMMKELNLDLPYSLAIDGKWTIDKLKQYCSAAANLNGDASFKFDVNGKATYGIVSFASAVQKMLYGMNVEYVSRDDSGTYHFTADTDPKFTDAVETLINFWGPDDGMAVFGTSTDLDPDGYFGIFEANRALFLSAELKGATMLREWEGNFGLMPQPKYDEKQETYDSTVFNSVLSFCVPNTNVDLKRTGTIVDYLTYMSYTNLIPRYYDIHVSLKALGKQESIDVLALIRGTRGVEVSVPYNWTASLDDAITKLVSKNEHSIASTIETYREACVAAITKTYDEYPALNNVNE